MNYDFDFISFAETNIHSVEVNQFTLSSKYNYHLLPRKSNKQKGSGMIMYYRTDTTFFYC